jgi:uncharacterized glyoxalase superfamily protein PhnB
MAKKARKGAAKKSAARRPAPAKSKAKARKPAPRAARPSGPAWKPPGSQQVIVNLVSNNAGGAIEFYKNAFGAKEQMRMSGPGGKVMHAELRIGDSVLYINDAMPGGPTEAPGQGRKPTSSIQLYVPDVDEVYDRAVQAGATSTMAVADQFWGDRMGGIVDPFGQSWGLLTRVKAMSEAQMRKAGEEFMAKMASQGGGGPPPASAAQ